MIVQVLSGRQAFGYRLTCLLIALAMVLPALAAPATVAHAQEAGETDPAFGYTEWPDDELFVAYPPQVSGAQRMSVYEPGDALDAQTEADHIEHAAANAHDAVAAVGGRFLTFEHDSILYAFRHNSTQVGLKFFDPNTTNPITQLDSLAARITGGTDFIDIGAGDMDGVLAADGEYREEAIVAWAKPSGDQHLPVSVAVLSFGDATEAAPAPTSVTIAPSSTTLDGVDIASGLIRRADNALSLAIGDFNGDDVKEVAVAYISDKSTVTLDVFQYTVTLNGTDIVRTLTRIGSATVTTGSYILSESLSLAAGNFDGDMEHGRDELALATSEQLGAEHDVRLRLFDLLCTDGADCSTSPDMTVTQSGVPSNLAAPVTDLNPLSVRKVQIVPGVFILDPTNPNRQTLAATYTVGSTLLKEGRLRILNINLGLGVTLGEEVTLPTPVAEKFWMASGGFKGTRSEYDPVWSLVWSYWNNTGSKYQHVYLHPTTFPGAPEVISSWASPEIVTDPASGGRSPVVAADTNGDSMYLGAPVHIILYDVLRLDYILQEPPKHAYWDPALAQVYSVSRTDDFNITMVDSNNQSFSTKSTDSSDWSIGSSASASASVTVKENFSTVIGGESAEVSAGISGKVGYDYKEHESDYNSNSQERTVTFSGSTNKDDYVVGRLQVLHIWRYRLFGTGATDPNQSPFYEIVFPGSATGLNGEIGELYTDAGGLNFDWYQPTHENGNILSYPEFTNATFNPPDLGSYTVPCEPGTTGCTDGQKTVTELMLVPSVKFCDGNTGSVALNFSSSSGSGEEHSSSHTLAENVSVKGSFKSEATIGTKRKGVSMSASISAEAELHNSNSWGSAETSDYKTSSSTGITLNRKGCSANNAYAYYPVLYQTTDGTIKATFAVDPMGSNSGKQWWIDNYGQQPDLALNLPQRFYLYTASQWNTANWTPTSSVVRKQMRGFFVRHNEPNTATGSYDEYAGAVTDGDTARLEARVYNYSLTQGVPAGATVRFDAVPYDWSTNRETGTRTTIGSALLPSLAPRQMVTVAIQWNTTGKSLNTAQTYRIYVVLDPGNTVTEKYEIESKATQFYFTVDLTHPAGGYWMSCANLSDTEYAAKNCIDPAQNNEGYGYVTVSKTPTTGGLGQKLDADVSMDEGGLAALNAEGELVSGPLEAMAGQPLEIRITVHSDTPGHQFSHVLVFDGDPKQGGVPIAGKNIFTGAAEEEGSSVWFEWAPRTVGQHRLYAIVTETDGDAQLNNNTDTMDVAVLLPGSRSYLPMVMNQ